MEERKRLSIVKRSSPSGSRSKRVSFSKMIGVKEFLPGEEGTTFWGTSYEEKADSLEINKTPDENITSNKAGHSECKENLLAIATDRSSSLETTEISMSINQSVNLAVSYDNRTFEGTIDVPLNAYELRNCKFQQNPLETKKIKTKRPVLQPIAIPRNLKVPNSPLNTSMSFHCSFANDEELAKVRQDKLAKKSQQNELTSQSQLPDAANKMKFTNLDMALDQSADETSSALNKTNICVDRMSLISEKIAADGDEMDVSLGIQEEHIRNPRQTILSRNEFIDTDDITYTRKGPQKITRSGCIRKTIFFNEEEKMDAETNTTEQQSNPLQLGNTRNSLLFPNGEKISEDIPKNLGINAIPRLTSNYRPTIVFDTAEDIEETNAAASSINARKTLVYTENMEMEPIKSNTERKSLQQSHYQMIEDSKSNEIKSKRQTILRTENMEETILSDSQNQPACDRTAIDASEIELDLFVSKQPKRDTLKRLINDNAGPSNKQHSQEGLLNSLTSSGAASFVKRTLLVQDIEKENINLHTADYTELSLNTTSHPHAQLIDDINMTLSNTKDHDIKLEDIEETFEAAQSESRIIIATETTKGKQQQEQRAKAIVTPFKSRKTIFNTEMDIDDTLPSASIVSASKSIDSISLHLPEISLLNEKLLSPSQKIIQRESVITLIPKPKNNRRTILTHEPMEIESIPAAASCNDKEPNREPTKIPIETVSDLLLEPSDRLNMRRTILANSSISVETDDDSGDVVQMRKVETEWILSQQPRLTIFPNEYCGDSKNASIGEVKNSNQILEVPHTANARHTIFVNDSISVESDGHVSIETKNLKEKPKNLSIQVCAVKGQPAVFSVEPITEPGSTRHPVSDENSVIIQETLVESDTTTTDHVPTIFHKLIRDSICFSKTAKSPIFGCSLPTTPSSTFSPNTTAALCNIDPSKITGAGYERRDSLKSSNSSKENTTYCEFNREYVNLTFDNTLKHCLENSDVMNETPIDLIDSIAESLRENDETMGKCCQTSLILQSRIEASRKDTGIVVDPTFATEMQRSLCRKCRNCRQTLSIVNKATTIGLDEELSDADSSSDSDSDFEIDFSKLRKLQNKPRMADVLNKAHERLAAIDLESDISIENISDNESSMLPDIPSVDFLMNNYIKEYSKSLEEERNSRGYVHAIYPLTPAFETLWRNRLNTEVPHWSFNYFNLPIGILECRHKNVQSLRLLIRFDAKELYRTQCGSIKLTKVKLEECPLYNRLINYPVRDKILNEEVFLRSYKDYTKLCETSNELFKTFDEIEKIIQKAIRLTGDLMKITFLNHARLECDERGNCIVRKIIPLETERINEFRIRVRHIEKMSFMDVSYPARSYFGNLVNSLPTGLEFLKTFIVDPISFLK